jgi:superfamily II DNA or RNA helicase
MHPTTSIGRPFPRAKNLPPEPREWQRLALEAWHQEGNRGVVAVATGGGKTLFALQCIDALAAANQQFRTLIVVPTIALLDQWQVALTWDYGLEPSDIKVLTTKDPLPSAHANIVVINTGREITIPDHSSTFLIVDECHRAGSPHNSRALFQDSAAALGLSATPERTYDEGFAEFVVSNLGPIVFEYTLKDAIRDGVLSALNLTNVRIPLMPDEEEEYSALTKRIGRAMNAGGSEDSVKSLLMARSRVSNNAAFRLPVAVRIAAQNPDAKKIIFFESIAQANQAVDLLNGRDLSATLYHSEIGDSLRRDNLRLFRRGVFNTLVACRSLDEGLDVPEAEMAIIAAGTASPRQRIQRIGRVIRTYAGKEHGKVYTLYATQLEEERLIVEMSDWNGLVPIAWTEVQVVDDAN